MSSTSTNQDARIIKILGSGYNYRFSRGLLAHELELRGLDLSIAYKVARKVHNTLITEGIKEIEENKLRRYVRAQALQTAGVELAYQYNIIEKWHSSSIPLTILISGSKGTGTSLVGKILSDKLAYPQVVSTSVVTQILRRMISPDLAPELHSKSYLAHKKLRPIYSVLYDRVIVGFEEHSRFVAEAVEALVQRSINEGLSMIIRGEELVERFLSTDLTTHPNVLYVTLSVKDESQHLERYLSYYDQSEWKERRNNFTQIRKIHDYLIETATAAKHIVIENSNISITVQKIYDLVLDKLRKLFPDSGEFAKTQLPDDFDIHS